MIFYYLLLFADRFHEYPRLGGVLFQAGPVVVTVTKLVGLVAVVASFVIARPPEATARARSSISVLFCAFAIYSLLGTFAFEGSPPGTSLSSLISFALLLIATQRILCTETRVKNATRAFVIAAALSTFWVYKQHLSGEQRAWGISGDPNYEALEIIMVVPLALWMARSETQRFWRVAGATFALMLTAATLMTESRGALLVIPIVAIDELRRMRGRPALRVVVVLGFAMLLLLAPASVWQRFRDTKVSGVAQNGDQASTLIRKELLRAGWKMIRSHPVFGVGLDSYTDKIDTYEPALLTQFRVTKGVACNTFLQVAAEAGVPALLLFLAIMVQGYANWRAVGKRLPGTTFGDLAGAMRVSLFCYAVTSLFLTAWVCGPYWFIVFASANAYGLAAERDRQTLELYWPHGLKEDIFVRRMRTVPQQLRLGERHGDEIRL